MIYTPASTDKLKLCQRWHHHITFPHSWQNTQVLGTHAPSQFGWLQNTESRTKRDRSSRQVVQ